MHRVDSPHPETGTALLEQSALNVPPERVRRVPATPGNTPGAAALLKGLRRRWVPAVCVGLVLAAGAAFAARLALPEGKHTAHVKLYVSSTAPRLMFNTQENRSEFNTYLKSQMALLKSRPVLRATLAREEVAGLAMLQRLDNPLEWLEAKLQVDNQLAPEILRVSLTGDERDELVVIVNAVADCYLHEVVNKERNDRLARLKQLEDITKKYEGQIRESKQKRKSLAEKMGSGDPQALAIRERLLAERLAAPEKELLQVQSELRKLQIEAANLKSAGPAPEPTVLDADIEATLDKDPVVVQLQTRVVQAEESIERVRQVVDRELSDPIFSRYRSELESAKNALAERRRTTRAQVIDQLKQKAKLEAKTGADTLDKRIASLKVLEKDLTDEVARIAGQLEQLTKSATALESFKDSIAEAEDLTKKLNLEKEQRTVEIQAPPRIALWEEGVVVQADNERRRLLATALAAIGTFAFVLFAFGWWEFHARRIYAVDDVVNGLGMRVMGVIPPWPGRQGLVRPSTLSSEPGTQGPFIEAMDSVRTMVVHATHVDQLRVLMVTSAVQGEGKTLLASHLAARMAASGRRTLLIDGDLRKPAVHSLFTLKPSPGLAELLRGEVAPEAVIQPVGDGMLDVITAGTLDGLACQALSQGRMHAVIEDLKDRYELIVIDSSPVLPVPDALLMGQQADGVVFAVLRDFSRIPKVNAAAQRLEALGVPVLGTVVNGGGGEGDGAVYP